MAVEREESAVPLVTRRAVIGASALGAGLFGGGILSGCTVSSPPKPVVPSSSEAAVIADASELAIAHATSAEIALIALYDATLAAHPDLAARLEPIRADHAAHLAALTPASATPGAGDIETPAPSATATSDPSPPGAPTTPVPGAPAEAVSNLAAAERAAAAARVDDLEPVTAGLAQLLAVIGASEAAHAALLVTA